MASITQKAPKGRTSATSAPIVDSRFANIHTDPRFRLPSKRITHVQLDKRFARMLRDDDFSKTASVDKYGRVLSKGSGKKKLEKFYRLDEEQIGSGADGEKDGARLAIDNEDDVRDELVRVGRKYDPAREGGFSTSEDSSDEDEDDAAEISDEESNAFQESRLGEQLNVPMGDVSSRLAVVNLDWDNIRAVDLMAVFSSFCPSSGQIDKVAIYPSQFGKERMDREEIEGPPRELFATKSDDRDDPETKEDFDDEEQDDDDEKIKESLLQENKGDEVDSSKLRRYQLERLRYYYAVLTFSSSETAKTVYDATDGTEYLTTANFFDLRFVPDDVSFDDDTPRDICTAIPDGYKPNTFVTDALQHSKVKLTWDAEDNVRKEVVKKAFSGSRADIEENDLKAYLGSDSSDDEDAPDAANKDLVQVPGEAQVSKKERERQRIRAALGLDSSSFTATLKSRSAPVGDMQITFSAGLSDPKKKGTALNEKPDGEETTVERYVRKEKERKQKRKEKATLGQGSNEGGPGKTEEGITDKMLNDTGKELAIDAGFDDPFFENPESQMATTKNREAKHGSKSKSKRSRKEEDEMARNEYAKKRAELELLMLDDNVREAPHDDGSGGPALSKLSHFDMNEIARAEKLARRKKQSSKRKVTDDGGVNHQDGFDMNVDDPRFAALYQNHEFAIDPTSSKYRDTQGMRALLEEGRRKRRRAPVEDVEGHNEDVGAEAKPAKRRRDLTGGESRDTAGSNDNKDLQKLVERVKGKTKAIR